jgi:hypothetical protein
MFGSKRNPRASLGYVTVLAVIAMILAACTSFHWITPVPTLETSPAEAAVTPEPGTPEPAAVAVATEAATEEATEEAVAEATAEAAEEAAEDAGDEAEDEAEDDVVAAMVDDMMPAPITHSLARREFCSDCHAVDTGKEPAPASHVNLTDDLCLYCHMPEEGEAAVPALPDPVTKEFCLACHGPFEELMARTTDYRDMYDEEVNPHVYVPHDKTTIFACDKCHEVHSLPVTEADEIPEADVEYCFDACHHERTWEVCSNCHDE